MLLASGLHPNIFRVREPMPFPEHPLHPLRFYMLFTVNLPTGSPFQAWFFPPGSARVKTLPHMIILQRSRVFHWGPNLVPKAPLPG